MDIKKAKVQSKRAIAWERGKCPTVIAPSTIEERDSLEWPNRPVPYTDKERADFEVNNARLKAKTCVELGTQWGQWKNMGSGYIPHLRDLDAGTVKDPGSEAKWDNVLKFGTPWRPKIRRP